MSGVRGLSKSIIKLRFLPITLIRKGYFGSLELSLYSVRLSEGNINDPGARLIICIDTKKKAGGIPERTAACCAVTEQQNRGALR